MEDTPKCDLCGVEAVFYSVFDDLVCEGCLDKHPDKGDTVFGLINDPEDE